MKYISYQGTPYEKKVNVPKRKKFGGRSYELADIFPNYGGYNGHKAAKNYAQDLRARGYAARVEAHSGYTVVYYR